MGAWNPVRAAFRLILLVISTELLLTVATYVDCSLWSWYHPENLKCAGGEIRRDFMQLFNDALATAMGFSVGRFSADKNHDQGE